jgi:hypothetical protein
MLLQASTAENQSWWSEHSTLIVGVVGIVFSGFIGPTVTALWTSRRERQKDIRARHVARRDDLREVVDEAAKALGGAVSKLRPLLEAEQRSQDPPKESVDFISTLFPLGQRLQLRLPESDPVVVAYELVRQKLIALAAATGSQQQFDTAIAAFETERAKFLTATRDALHAPITDKE